MLERRNVFLSDASEQNGAGVRKLGDKLDFHNVED